MRVFSTRILAKILRNLYIFTWLTKTLICSHVTSKKFFEFFEYLRMALQYQVVPSLDSDRVEENQLITAADISVQVHDQNTLRSVLKITKSVC